MQRSSTTPVIESLPTRLDAEGWLALGFPALRTVTWRPTRGPQLDARRTRPNPEDVLPLVVGAPDPRVDDLKQWLVDIDYRINNKDDQNGARYKVLRDEFFKVLGRLTGGLKVEYGKVNFELKQVILITDDGEVPIESVSQGTISLLGWIGVLMQRLYEVYGHAVRPIEQSALVLIDEIDAHMHPAWQLRLVPLLRDIFPRDDAVR
jgi:AAA domain, putative AbiEii toxin, Type IV TA system